MKKEQILELINAIPPDLIEEADLQAPARRPVPKPARVGLIAACLCLALLGTAAAARYFGVRIHEKDEEGITWISGGIAYYPVDSLSQEVRALDDPYYAVRKFDSWDEMEEFIGVDFMNNPVLDASPAVRYSFGWNDGVNHIRGRFLAVAASRLTSIYAIGCYEVDDVKITINGSLFTDRMAEDWDEEFYGFRYPEGTQMERDTYTASSGLEAQLLRISPPGGKDEYWAVFTLNGVPFVAKAGTSGDVEEARAALIQVLDGFAV